MPIRIFRDRLIQSPRHRKSPLPVTQSLQATSKTHAVQPILLPTRSSRNILPKTGNSHPILGLAARSVCKRQNTLFLSQSIWDTNTSYPSLLSLLFTQLSCSPCILEIAGKPNSPPGTAHAPFACLRRRLQLLGMVLAQAHSARQRFLPCVHANGACTARAAPPGRHVLRRPRHSRRPCVPASCCWPTSNKHISK